MKSPFSRRFDQMRSVFGIRTFLLFSIGNFSSLVGIWLIRVCIGWLTWEQTQSKAWLGMMAFAELGPSVFISIYAGHLADKHDRLRILRFGQSIQTFLALALVAMVLLDRINVWLMFTILLGYSVIGGLNLPARMSIAPSLVPRENLATATAIGSISFNISRLIGPLLAAPLQVINAEHIAFALAALLFATNAFCLSRVTTTEPARSANTDQTAEFPGFLQVLRELVMDRAILLVLSLQFAIGLFMRPVAEMFPAFADQIFHRGENGYAMLNMALGLGAVLGALFVVGGMAGRAMRSHILFGSLLFGVTGMMFSASQMFWAALLAQFCHGLALTSSGVAMTTFVQINIPRERLGRVMSIYSIIFRLAPALGAVALGALADVLGLQVTTAAFCALGIVVVFYVWRPFVVATNKADRMP